MTHFIRLSLTLGLALSLTLPALAKTPDKAFDLFQIGQIYARQKMLDQAVEAYSGAIQVNPKFEQAYISLAIVYSMQKKYKKALKELTVVMKLYPKAYVPYKVQGMVYRDMKRNKEAVAAFKTYLKKAPPKKIKDKADLEKLIQELNAK